MCMLFAVIISNPQAFARWAVVDTNYVVLQGSVMLLGAMLGFAALIPYGIASIRKRW
jgi:hypothetical protein